MPCICSLTHGTPPRSIQALIPHVGLSLLGRCPTLPPSGSEQENTYIVVQQINRILYSKEYKQTRAVDINKDEFHSHNEE